ncbi:MULTISPECIES: RSP_2648 family PIN domain-containing protein [Halocynthiibacter]|uniref:PIN domain-containing protein n=1 Tax=Halocynthiibacter halioticoli TaxID=2986804 RepID=A0AAE3J0D4_9RHOB|nr:MULTISPECIES: PIN domain-containing protein [Halocynthiibacter]MCV6824213.1 PIN domain-containing protein [Halocynthiibacter halioticoli]MCW4057214.1 PIN domain-containing protein [Halocynthiibacter sp. SDUM655004]
MKILLDACVLYPTVMREALIGAAKAGLYTPLWSERILEEWARATIKLGAGAETIARGEIAVLKAQFPNASVSIAKGVEARLYLPDPNDIHVLAAAVSGHADAIVTLNRKDFPAHILAEEDVKRLDPDHFLLDLFQRDPDAMQDLAERIRLEASRLSGEDQDMRKLFKKARLPRFAKAVSF